MTEQPGIVLTSTGEDLTQGERPDSFDDLLPPRGRGRLFKFGQVWLVRIIALVAILGSWQLCTSQRLINPLFTSYPSAIAIQFVHVVSGGVQASGSTVWVNLLATLEGTFFGFILGSALGIFLAMVFVLIPLFEQSLRPLIFAMNSMPRIALAPLFVIWFGLGVSSKIALAISVVFFIVLQNTYVALEHPDRNTILLARTLGYSRRSQMRKFVIPQAVPVVFAGLQLSLVFSFLSVVAGEFIGGTRGMGVLLSYDANTLSNADFFSNLLVLMITATLISQGMRFLEKKILRWHIIESRGTQ